jgi:hypothetical protein
MLKRCLLVECLLIRSKFVPGRLRVCGTIGAWSYDWYDWWLDCIELRISRIFILHRFNTLQTQRRSKFEYSIENSLLLTRIFIIAPRTSRLPHRLLLTTQTLLYHTDHSHESYSVSLCTQVSHLFLYCTQLTSLSSFHRNPTLITLPTYLASTLYNPHTFLPSSRCFFRTPHTTHMISHIQPIFCGPSNIIIRIFLNQYKSILLPRLTTHLPHNTQLPSHWHTPPRTAEFPKSIPRGLSSSSTI